MDEIDSRLLTELKKNARAGNTELAKKLRISEGTVRNRINRLIEVGTIIGFRADVSLKERFAAIVLVKTTAGKPTESIAEEISKINGFDQALEVTGEWDIVLLSSSESAEDFNRFIEKVRKTKGVFETQSLIVLKKT